MFDFIFFYFIIYLNNTYTYSVDCIISIHNSGEKAVGSWGDIQQWGGSGEWPVWKNGVKRRINSVRCADVVFFFIYYYYF